MKTTIPYNVISTGNDSTITFFDPAGSGSKTLSSAHPNYTRVRDCLLSGDGSSYADLAVLVDTKTHIAQSLSKLSDHISYDGTNLLWDGDVINNALARHMLRLLKDNDQRYVALVHFMERLAKNPSQVSRVHLWTWLESEDFTITPDGLILGYKGVQNVEDNLSVRSGVEPVYVNGVAHIGHIPNPAGVTVEIPRSYVQTDRNVACSVGLHVGTWNYANGFGRKLLRVLVDPADVVSVPKDSDCAKMRVSRYVVLDASEKKVVTPIFDYVGPFDDDDDDDDYCSDCGAVVEECACDSTCSECGENVDDCECL